MIMKNKINHNILSLLGYFFAALLFVGILLCLIGLLSACNTTKHSRKVDRQRHDSTGTFAIDTSRLIKQTTTTEIKQDSSGNSNKVEENTSGWNFVFDSTGTGNTTIESDGVKIITNKALKAATQQHKEKSATHQESQTLKAATQQKSETDSSHGATQQKSETHTNDKLVENNKEKAKFPFAIVIGAVAVLCFAVFLLINKKKK